MLFHMSVMLTWSLLPQNGYQNLRSKEKLYLLVKEKRAGIMITSTSRMLQAVKRKDKQL